MAITTAREFAGYSQTAQDGGWGTDVDEIIASGTSPGSANTICAHPSSAGTTSITVDPHTTRSTQGEARTNFGFACNADAASGVSMGSTSTAKRRIPAGVWNFRQLIDIPAPALLGSHNVTLSWRIFRVGPAPTFTRTTLFTVTSAEHTNSGVSAITSEQVDGASASQPEIVLEAGETWHMGILSTNRQVAAPLFGATTAGNIVFRANAPSGWHVQVPAPGIRTINKSSNAVAMSGVATLRKTIETSKLVALTAVAVFNHTVEAFRSFAVTMTATAAIRKTVTLTKPVAMIGVVSIRKTAHLTKLIVMTSIATIRKTIYKTFEVVMTGVAAFNKSVLAHRGFVVVMTGVAGFAKVLEAHRGFQVVMTGVAAFDKTVTAFRGFVVQMVGVASIRKTVRTTKSVALTGVAAFTKRVTAFKAFLVHMVGVAAFTKVLEAHRGFQVVLVTVAGLFVRMSQAVLNRLEGGAVTIKKIILGLVDD